MNKDRYERIVLKVEGNVEFEVSPNDKELIITARDFEKTVIHYGDYKKPPIPYGYKHVEGEWLTGFVIERSSDGSQFVWVPVGGLDSNGVSNDNHYDKKFGRRFSYTGETLELPTELYLEKLTPELKKQFESVEKYGGFYISRYYISHVGSDYKSVGSTLNMTNLNYYEAVAIASSIEIGKDVSSHLLYASEIDSEIQWINQFKIESKDILIDEWTKEMTYGEDAVIRPRDERRFSFERIAVSPFTKSRTNGFRVALYIR